MRTLFRNLLAAAAAALVVAVTVLFFLNEPVRSAERSAEDIYLDKCALCHGKDGAGKTAKGKKVKVKDIRETVNKMSEEEMIKIVEKGKGQNMDSYEKEYSKEQIKALVEYYRSLAKK